MKYHERQTFRFKSSQKVAVCIVHTHGKYQHIPMNAEDATIVRGDKGTAGVPAQRKCPFIVDSNCTTTYLSVHDMTYGEIHAAVVDVKDYLTIIPDMIASNEMAPSNIESKTL